MTKMVNLTALLSQMLLCDKCGNEMTYAEWPKRGSALKKYCCAGERDRRKAKDFVRTDEGISARCTDCNEVKSFLDFHKNGDRLRSMCKDCWNSRKRERYGNKSC